MTTCSKIRFLQQPSMLNLMHLTNVAGRINTVKNAVSSSLCYNSGLNEVVIVSAVRTPTGSFQKSLAKLTAPELGAVAIRGAIDKAGLTPADIEEVLMGNVVSAGVGQAPARQAALKAGCPVTDGSHHDQQSGDFLRHSLCRRGRGGMVAGGMESMSNVPFYFPRGAQYGHQSIQDGIIKDGLWDVYNQIHMGTCAEETATEYNISREEQDAHAIESYTRAAEAWKKGWFKAEVVPVTIKDRKGDKVFAEDEEYRNVKFDKIPTLNTVFKKNGTITAANASTLNDGASALVLTTLAEAERRGLTPLARVLSYGDAATEPKKFTIAPSLAIPIALERAGLGVSDVSLFEINEAFSVVVRANEKILGLDPSKVNIGGGGVSLGHPIGSSGSRIVVSLVHLLKKGQIGVAGICNGGGAASSLVIERL
ncbi:thiolase-like protein [Chytridium lagenaria]|nr:thiolase-like protein [Chytridium lagenaria]